MAGYSEGHSPLPNCVSICLRITNYLLWSMVNFDLTECSPSRVSSHHLLPPVGSVPAILASQLDQCSLSNCHLSILSFWAAQASRRQPRSNPVLLQLMAKLPSASGDEIFPWYSMGCYTVMEIPV